MDRKPIHDMTAEEIAEITEAFTDYPYKTGERGLKDCLGGRGKTARYTNAFIRAALKAGWIYPVGEGREAFIAVRTSDQRVPAMTMLSFLCSVIRILGFRGAFRLMKQLNREGLSLEEKLKGERRPFLKVEMLCVRKRYQGQGYMRKAIETAFSMAEEMGMPCILDTDAQEKMERYCHLGMTLAGKRRIDEQTFLYDLIREP